MSEGGAAPGGNRKLKRIGWKEVVDLPEWGIRSLLAKADTGARGSAIDVDAVERLPDGRVRFRVVLNRKDRGAGHEVVAQIRRSTRVRSSNGEVQERIIVRTSLEIGDDRHEIDLSLVARKRMICRLLLGRHALAGHFVVDSEEKYLHGPRRRARTKTRQSRSKKASKRHPDGR